MLSSEVRAWFSGRLPEGLYDELVDVTVDREEITVIGRIPAPTLTADTAEAERAAAVAGKVSEFRERTRSDRMAVAEEAESRYRRKVAWGVDCDGERVVFTNVSAPVMTRLRQPERRVLDLLVEGGVARSRSDALGWCVKLVQRHAGEWLGELSDSLAHVQQVRANAPDR